MKSTYFEREFLGINNSHFDSNKDKDDFNPSTVLFFYELLMRINEYSMKDWDIDLLRNYIDAFYAKSETAPLPPNESEKCDVTLHYNIFDCKQNIRLFYTGLRQQNDRLFILFDQTKKDFWNQRTIVSENELNSLYGSIMFDEKRIKDCFYEPIGSEELVKMIDNLKQFSKELDEDAVLKLVKENKYVLEKRKEILDKIIYSDFDFYIKYKDYCPKCLQEASAELKYLRSMYNASSNKMPIKLRGWLHILIDGVDNLPAQFFKSMFNLRLCDNFDDYYYRHKVVIHEALNGTPTFLCYCKIIQNAVYAALQNVENVGNEFPRSFYKNITQKDNGLCVNESRDNYILPISLSGKKYPDFCLVVIKRKKLYEFSTILNMDEIYTNMRVLGEKVILDSQDKWNLWPANYLRV